VQAVLQEKVLTNLYLLGHNSSTKSNRLNSILSK
jgi:hypothetical protein